MAKAEQQKAGQPELFDRVLANVTALVKKHVLHILLAAGLIAVGVIAYRTMVLRRKAARMNQWAGLTLYPEITPFITGPDAGVGLHEEALKHGRELLAESSETRATPWLLLKVGNLYATGSRWQEAEQTYRRILTEHPDSGAAEAAGPARAVALEQLGRYEEAAALYRRLNGNDPEHLLAAGRCLELAGRLDQARAAYGSLLAKQPPDRERGLAQFRLQELEEGQPLEAPPELETMLSAAAERRAEAEQKTVPAETPMQASPAPPATPMQTSPAAAPSTPLQSSPPAGPTPEGTD